LTVRAGREARQVSMVKSVYDRFMRKGTICQFFRAIKMRMNILPMVESLDVDVFAWYK